LNAENLQSTYLRLRPDCSVEKLPVDDTFWPRLMSGALGNFHQEYLVASFSYASDWPNWEMHPNGDEIVALISGAATLVLESSDGSRRSVELTEPGSFAFVPRGTWHTARVNTPTTMFFITPGEGTQHRSG
jgi:mannose-6-phosphate isomerase-like protein (cupin superfamily)